MLIRVYRSVLQLTCFIRFDNGNTDSLFCVAYASCFNYWHRNFTVDNFTDSTATCNGCHNLVDFTMSCADTLAVDDCADHPCEMYSNAKCTGSCLCFLFQPVCVSNSRVLSD